MSFVGRVSATKGTLQRVKQQYSFIKKGKEILEMKRDRLAGDINKLLPELRRRPELEKEFTKLYKELMKAIASRGITEFESAGKAVNPMETKYLEKSIMGVIQPEISIAREPNIDMILSPVIIDIAKKFYKIFNALLELSIIEAKVERIAIELMDTNRKVNALEKIVIPAYEELIRYIEDRLMEEDLEEFVRTKYIISRQAEGK
jgi:V/A-type H+-transporting ATPase subunit D